jgi:hypothetical protein
VSTSSHFPQLRPQADLIARFYNLLSRCEGGRCPKWVDAVEKVAAQ